MSINYATEINHQGIEKARIEAEYRDLLEDFREADDSYKAILRNLLNEESRKYEAITGHAIEYDI